jgi:hypothetical protein
MLYKAQAERIKNNYPQISQIYADFQETELQNALTAQYSEHVTSCHLEN